MNSITETFKQGMTKQLFHLLPMLTWSEYHPVSWFYFRKEIDLGGYSLQISSSQLFMPTFHNYGDGVAFPNHHFFI